jgi:microcystin-dependent protein
MVIQGFLNENFPGIIKQSGVPAQKYQDRLWFNEDDGFIYFFLSGRWVRPFPGFAANSKKVIMWPGSLTELWSEDGGDGTDPTVVAPTAFTGSFWIPVTAYQGRVPIAPGTIPGAFVYPTTTPVTIADQGATIDSSGKSGEYANTLDLTSIPLHRHLQAKNEAATNTGNYLAAFRNDGNYALDPVPDEPDILLGGKAGGDASNSDVTKPHNNMMPYFSIYFIQRTARQWIIAA